MPETAEIPRETAPAEAPAPAPRLSFAELAQNVPDLSPQIDEARKRRDVAATTEKAGLEAGAAAQAPALNAAMATAQAPKPSVPKPPTITPPPSRGLHAFMAPIEGEAPEKSLAKFIATLGLFAAGIGGAAKGNARGSLAALSGAMKGWSEGDAERADRAFKDWQAKTNAALTAWDTERATYDDTLKAADLDLETKLTVAKLTALKHDNQQLAKAFETGRLDKAVGELESQQKHADALRSDYLRLQQHHEDRVKAEEYQRAVREETARHNRETERRADAAVAETIRQHDRVYAQKDREIAQGVGATAPPDVIETLADKYLRGENFPPNLMRGKSGQQLALKVVERATTKAREMGIDPSDLPGIKADLDANRKALAKLRGTSVTQEAQAARFDTHMDALIQLSQSTDRSGVPVFNRFLLKAQGKYGGDVDVAKFEVQALEVAMEYAKLTVGTAQGDAATREEARKVISTWMTHPQLTGVGETLKQNAHNNVANNRAEEQRLVNYIDTLGGHVDKPAPKPAVVTMPNDPPKGTPPGGRITITNGTRRGTIAAEDLNKLPKGWRRAE